MSIETITESNDLSQLPEVDLYCNGYSEIKLESLPME